jgi:hypothetical protein
MTSEGTAAAITRYRHVHCLGVDRSDVIVADFHPGCGAGQEVLDNDVGSRRELPHQLLSRTRLHVYSDRPWES